MADKKKAYGSNWTYDAFLSFRGEDTRKNFIDHLYYALKNAGINVFKDDRELRRGDDITSELEKAIQGSKIAVVVFSEKYADSRWCLEELVKIMECRRTLNQLVLPIFYNVDPTDVRKQTGSFENAFSRHQEYFPSDIDRVVRWRMALTEVANLSGWDLRNTADRHEAKFIKLIVENISMKLDNTFLFVALNLVGIDYRVKAITSRLDVGSSGVLMVGIWGMGGIGKTTVAKAIYNELARNFEGTCFLANINEISEQPNGLVHLQEQLLSSSLNSHKIKVHSVDHGIILLRERLCHKRLLVILDDVNQMEQLNALARSRKWFGLGSRIIVTTRDEHLLSQVQVDAIYKVDEMNDTEALELFSWHAFRNSEPNEALYGLSRSVVNYCGGLPLALEVLGSFLFGRSIPEWEDTLDKLKTIPNDQIQKKLRISYEGLSDHLYKDIFLDISCHLIGMDKNDVIQILDGCGFFPRIGISVLLQRCLLKSEGNKLMMHDLLRDMGREIVRKESPKEPGKRSRLFLCDEVRAVLTRQKGTQAIEGLTLKLPLSHEITLKTEAFSEMQNLRLLELSHVHLSGGFEQLSQELRWLLWHGFPMRFLPKDFDMEKLVAIDLRYSQLRLFLKEPKFLGKLKILNLSHSHYLTHTPDFLQLPNLEKLKLKDCKSLVELHHSIGNLERLVFANLKDCISLKKLPVSFTKLRSLETLILSGCSKLDGLPEDLGEMQSLTTLIADDIAIQEVPSTIVKLKKLTYLSLSRSKSVVPSKSLYSIFWFWNTPRKYSNCIVLPASLQGLDSLTRLRLKSCNLTNDAIPIDIGSLVSLVELDLGDNAFHSLPSSISGLTKLHSLVLDDCTNLQRIPDLSGAKHMKTLRVSCCYKLVEIPGLEKLLTSIEYIRMQGSTKMAKSFKQKISLQGWTSRGFGGMWYPGDNMPDSVNFEDDDHSVRLKASKNIDFNIQGLIVCNDLVSRPLSVMKYTKGQMGVATSHKPLTNDVITSIEDHLWQGHLTGRLKWGADGGSGKDTTNLEGVDFEAKLFEWPEYGRTGITILHI